MTDNNLYNLMTQLTQESRSLWRIENEYSADAEGDAAATAFWDKLADDKREHIEELQKLIKERMK
jgi:hypothetical protein